jgi:hypothetical protein
MINHAGLYVIEFPSGRFGYVGSIPTALGSEVPADRSAIMGGRAHRDATGQLVEWSFPSFATEVEAITYAAERGFTAAVPAA